MSHVQIPVDLDLVTGEAMQAVFHVKSAFLFMIGWIAAGHEPYSAVELNLAKIQKSASQHEGHHKVAPVELFQENYDIFEHVVCRVQDRAYDFFPDNYQVEHCC
jgi:hypothetical protein